MIEYLEKDYAINLLEYNTKVYHYRDRDKENIVRDTIERLCLVLREAPAADVQPVRCGEWEYIRNVKLSGTIKLCECSICHNKILGGLNYCGNCGAKMIKDNDTGCFGCNNAQWDADGCTCNKTGLLVGNVAKGCEYCKKDGDTND